MIVPCKTSRNPLKGGWEQSSSVDVVPSLPMTHLSSLVSLLRCLDCTEPLKVADLVNPGGYPELGPDGILECTGCTARYPIVAGTARMLRKTAIAELARDYPCSVSVLQQAVGKDGAPSPDSNVKQRTAESFAYEWSHFGQLREVYGQNFLGYMKPHSADFFSDLLLLDIGCGSGRHSYEAAKLGARVVAVDLGRSIDVARRNLPLDVLTVQADAELLPFEHSAFDFVMSIGVLHHLPNTERAFFQSYLMRGGRLRTRLPVLGSPTGLATAATGADISDSSGDGAPPASSAASALLSGGCDRLQHVRAALPRASKDSRRASVGRFVCP